MSQNPCLINKSKLEKITTENLSLSFINTYQFSTLLLKSKKQNQFWVRENYYFKDFTDK